MTTELANRIDTELLPLFREVFAACFAACPEGVDRYADINIHLNGYNITDKKPDIHLFFDGNVGYPIIVNTGADLKVQLDALPATVTIDPHVRTRQRITELKAELAELEAELPT
jgi:hypothetical protein